MALIRGLQQNTVTILDLSDLDIDDKKCEEIAKAFKEFHRIRAIDLRNNIFGNAGLNALIEAFKSNVSLENVDLSGNSISKEGATSLADLLANSDCKLKRLRISDESFELYTSVGTIIAASIKNNKSLTHLYLEEAQEQSRFALEEALFHNNILVTLKINDASSIEIENNDLETYMQAEVSKASANIKINEKLIANQLTNQDLFQPITLEKWDSILKTNPMQLEIKNPNIIDCKEPYNSLLHFAAQKGFLSVVKFLVIQGAEPWRYNANYKFALDLALENNHKEIVSYLYDKSYHPLLCSSGNCKQYFRFEYVSKKLADVMLHKMNHLSLSQSHNIYDNFINILCLQLLSCNLKSVKLTDILLKEVDITILVNSLKNNQSVTKLSLINAGIRDTKKLAELLKENNTITRLDLSNNHINALGGNYLSNAIKSNKSLTSLNLQCNLLDYSLSHFLLFETDLKKSKQLARVKVSQNFLDRKSDALFKEDKSKQDNYRYSIFKTKSHNKSVKSLMDPEFKITTQNWLLSVSCHKQHEHAMILMEGMRKNGQLFFHQYHIVPIEGSNDNDVTVEITNFDPNIFNKDSYYLNKHKIDCVQGVTLRGFVQDQVGSKIPFSRINSLDSNTINCVTWCKEVLNKINVQIDTRALWPSRVAQEKTTCIIL